MKSKTNNNDNHTFSLSKSNTINPSNTNYHKFRYNYYNPNKKYHRYFNSNDYYSNSNKYYSTSYKKSNSYRYGKMDLYEDDNEEEMNVYLTQLNKQNYFAKGKNDKRETSISNKEEILRIKVKLNEGNEKEIVLYKDDNVSDIVKRFCKDNNIGDVVIEKGLIDKIKMSLSVVDTVTEKGKCVIK